ncbi:MAG TPA: S8 family peptidase [Vicinamibacteria bacterium]|nr:S8 family peptidase [Vicinamibacteria bacterium]
MTTYGRRHLAAALVLALAVPLPVAAAKNAPGRGKASGKSASGKSARKGFAKVSEKVRRDASRVDNKGKIDVIVRFRSTPSTAEKALLEGVGGTLRRGLNKKSSSRWLAVRLPAHAVEKLAENPNVDFVASDPPVSPTLDVARQAAAAPPAYAPESLLKGAGVTVAVVDSGVAYHPDLQNLVASVDFVGSSSSGSSLEGSSLFEGDVLLSEVPTVSLDPYGHGTHVAGIVAGNGSQSAEAAHSGVAPQAGLVSVRVLDAFGSGSTSDVLAGLDWILANKDQYGIRVVNISLGHAVYEAAAVDPLVYAVDALWDAGVVVVCSAGNAGRGGYGTISSPCNSRKVITVGAVNDRGTADPSDDMVTTYSSRGPTAIDRVAKPDILAPGNRIVAARSAGSYLDELFPERRVAGDPSHPAVQFYVEMSGTSMASPMVAGTVALMLEHDPTLSPATVKARLMFSAKKAAVGHPFATGAGVLDILGALRTTGGVAGASSPRVTPSADTGEMGIENTAVLWGNASFSIMNVWSSAVLWSDPSQVGAETVWSYGVLWPDGTLWPEGTLWPDATLWPEGALWPDGTLWPESVLWPDSPVWTEAEAVLWPEAAGTLDIDIEPLALGTQDPL